MFSLDHHGGAVPYPGMVDLVSNLDRRLLGEAIRLTRERARMSQHAVAARLGITAQAFQRYEKGARALNDNRLVEVTAAMGSSVEALQSEYARVSERPAVGLELRAVGETSGRRSDGSIPVCATHPGRGPMGTFQQKEGKAETRLDVSSMFGPSARALHLAGEDMVPWGEPGELIIFDKSRHPKRGAGCVIETKDGEYYVRIYERTDGSSIFVRELNPEERTVSFLLSKIEGVYGVRFRGD